jgi:hypothetical protein
MHVAPTDATALDPATTLEQTDATTLESETVTTLNPETTTLTPSPATDYCNIDTCSVPPITRSANIQH